MADERTVPASSVLDATTLRNLDYIQQMLRDTHRTVDVSHLRTMPSAAAVAHMVDLASAASSASRQMDAVIKAAGLHQVPAIVEQITAKLMASQGLLRYAEEPLLASQPDPWGASDLLQATPDELGDEDAEEDGDSDAAWVNLRDDDLAAETVQEHLEHILQLPDYEAERLAIALGLTVERVPARMGVALVLSLLVIIQIVRPQLFDSLMQNKTHWQEIFKDAARYWG